MVASSTCSTAISYVYYKYKYDYFFAAVLLGVLVIGFSCDDVPR